MKIDLAPSTGLPIQLDEESCELIFGRGLNTPSYCVRKLHDLDPVWAHPDAAVPDRVIYRYTDCLWLDGDERLWKNANIVYGIVVFAPGTVGGEFIKSSGQYHPICPGNTQATPEVYTVLRGVGHFLLQKAAPPYDQIDDAILVDVREGETFVVPPDYGHLQINAGSKPLAFSYVVRDGMKGVYEPFKQRRGAIYFEMSGKSHDADRFIFNTNYPKRLPLRVVRAGDICQLPWLNDAVTYQKVREHLPQLAFVTDPSKFPESAAL